MPKRKKKKKGASSKPKRPRRSSALGVLFRFLLVASGVVAIGCIVTYIIIDHRTTRILAARSSGLEPAIYSDTRTLHKGQKIRPELLRSELSRRGYREVEGKPQHDGEFRVQSAQFQVKTRPFISSDGSEVRPASAQYDASSGNLSILGDAEASSFTLEPQVIASLTGTDVRASRFVPLAKIPKNVKNAVVAIEDERFYSHFGIDLIGIARAIVIDIKAMRLVQGGSTLTQQLAKNVFLSPRRTFGRKFLELFTAISLERHLSKDQVLEMYLNEVYLGQEGPVALHGVAEAAQAFFGKDLSQLTVGESAMLAGIIKAPSVLSPRRHLDRAIERRNVVLSQMQQLGYIDAKTAEGGKAERPKVVSQSTESRHAPHYTASLCRILSSEYDIDADSLSNLRIFTGLDLELQRCAERAVTAGVSDIEKRNRLLTRGARKLEAGLVAIEPFSGKVRAWAGGRNFGANQFDHVYQARRPIGSTIKPFVYLTALDGQLNRYKVATVTSILSDEPMTIKVRGAPDWSPENYDHRYRGDVTLRYALENSLNLPTVYLAQRVGTRTVAETVERFHVAKEVQPVPSLVLGTTETSLLDLSAAYGALANGGVYVKPRPFISALDRDGTQVSSVPVIEERVSADGPVYVLTNLLQGVVERGTATRVRSLGYTADAAGKTGTTDSARDAWFVGFTPDLVAGVWVGFDDNRRVGLTGGAAAVPIWTDFMKCAAGFREPLPFIPPPSVTFSTIDGATGQLAAPECPRENLEDEVFVKGTEPTTFCSRHGNGEEIERRLNLEEIEEERDTSPRRRRKSLWEQLFG